MGEEEGGKVEGPVGVSRIAPLEENTIVVGDCLQVMKQMPDGCVDLVVTDPPYGINYVSARPKRPRLVNVPIAGDDDMIWASLPNVAAELWRIAAPDSACFVFTRWDCWGKLKAAMSPWECKNMIVWDKGNHTAGDLRGNFGYAHELIYFGVKGRPLIRGRRVWNVWKCPRIPANRLTHPSEKPIPLVAVAIRGMSDEGDLVFDPFMGSGATAVAADRLGRNFFGCDISPEYVELSLKRLADDRLKRSQLELGLQ